MLLLLTVMDDPE
jgi:hypothetical protein